MKSEMSHPGQTILPLPRRKVLLGVATAAGVAWVGALAHADSQGGVCTFGVFPYVPALKIGDMFAPMALDLGRALGTGVQLRTKDTFEKFASELDAGSYDIVLVHPFLYVDAHSKQGYTAIARVDQELRAVIVSRRPEPVASLRDLRGATIALPPKLAGVSYMLRLAMLDAGLRPGADIELRHYQTKISCLHAVAAGDAVGCVIPSFMTDQLEAIGKMQLRPVWQSAPSSSLVVAVHPRLPEVARGKLLKQMMAWRSHDAGRRLLAALAWPGVVSASDQDYDRIRTLTSRLNAYAGG